jgi:hypothetical protein
MKNFLDREEAACRAAAAHLLIAQSKLTLDLSKEGSRLFYLYARATTHVLERWLELSEMRHDADRLLHELATFIRFTERLDRDDRTSDGHSIRWHAEAILANARAYLRRGEIDSTVYTPHGAYTPIFTREGKNWRFGDFFTVRFEEHERGLKGEPDYHRETRVIHEWRNIEEPDVIAVAEVVSVEPWQPQC